MNTNDGLVIHGTIYAAGPMTDSPDAHKVNTDKVVLIGPSGTLRNGASSETTYCWFCLQKKIPNPLIVDLRQQLARETLRADTAERLRSQSSQTDYDSRNDDERSARTGAASGPMPPPEMPEIRDLNFLLPKHLRRDAP
jgi:hypothetical protein